MLCFGRGWGLIFRRETSGETTTQRVVGGHPHVHGDEVTTQRVVGGYSHAQNTRGNEATTTHKMYVAKPEPIGQRWAPTTYTLRNEAATQGWQVGTCKNVCDET